ncbi:MAG: CHAP domain-containing protein [Spirochaetaceae bacterium]
MNSRPLPPLLILIAILSGCATVGDGAPDYSKTRETVLTEPGDSAEAGHEIARAAVELIGRRDLTVRGRRFSFDCTGTVLAAYYAAGYDLAANFGAYTGNGVRRLYMMADDYGTLRNDTPLRPGDIIFWDNSYDRNEDRRYNDEFTHAGIVVAVERDDTITYVHHNYRRGVVMAKMNLRRPSDMDRNTPMRMASHRWRDSDPWLSGELYRAHGALY